MSEEMDEIGRRVEEQTRLDKESNQSLADWGFRWPTEIEQAGASMFGFGAALFGTRAGVIAKIVSCEDCGTLIGVPRVENMESFDMAEAPVNIHVRYCVGITALQREGRRQERVAAREELFDPNA